MAQATDRRRRDPDRLPVWQGHRSVMDHIAQAWSLADSGYRTEDGTSVAKNKARAVEHLEAAIAAIRGGR